MRRISAALVCVLSLLIIGLARSPGHSFPISPSYSQTTARTIPQYDLTIRVLPDAHRLEVSGTLRLPPTNTSRSEIRLSLSELMHDFHIEVLEPAASAGLAKVERRDAGSKNIKWTVRPVRPIPAGEAAKLRFSYVGGEKLANQFYIGPEVSFASAWGTDWYPLIDSKNDISTGTLQFSVPIGQTVYATGVDKGTTQEAARGEFRFETIHPTYFSFAAGNYSIVRRNASVPISAYLLKSREHIERYLDGVSKILNTLSQEFGSYPFDEFALVEIPRDLALKAGFNATAAQGFIFINSRAFDPSEVKYVLNFFGHEFSHQWFPHTIALKTPPGLYMEEALAEYGGLRVVETLAGSETAEQYRRTGFEYDPYFSALHYFKFVDAGVDQRLSDLQPKMEHRNLAYTKGFLVFDMLSREIGREKFQRILQGIKRRHAFRQITWIEFLRAIEIGAGRNLQWFYEQWFDRTGAPEFQVTWKQMGGRLRGVITQSSPYYRVSLQVEAKAGNGQRLIRVVKVHEAQTTFSFPAKFCVEAVTIDPHFLVLRWTPDYRKAAGTAPAAGK